MSNFGPPNAKGRSSGRLTGREKKLRGPPRDEPWVWLQRALIESPAWRSRGVNNIRFIEFLLAEHMAHAGRENGALMATYNQLCAWGVPRSEILKAIVEAEFLGLVRVTRGGYFGGKTECSLYRLTFYADREGNEATHEWKSRTEESIRLWRTQRKRGRKRKNKSSVRISEPDQVRLSVLDGGKSEKSA